MHSSSLTSCRLEAREARGFTLLEVLLSIAIILLVGTVLIGAAAHLTSGQPVSPYEVFLKAVQEARKTALKSEHDIRLRFDKEKKQFVIVDGLASATTGPDGMTVEERPLKVFPIPAANAVDLSVDFLGPSAKGGNAILVGGTLIESQTIKYVTFYSDGTCSAFRVQFVRGPSSNIVSMDRWTCAPVLTPNDPNTPGGSLM